MPPPARAAVAKHPVANLLKNEVFTRAHDRKRAGLGQDRELVPAVRTRPRSASRHTAAAIPNGIPSASPSTGRPEPSSVTFPRSATPRCKTRSTRRSVAPFVHSKIPDPALR